MPVDQQRDERGTVDRTATIARRPLLRSLAWGGALGAPAVRALSGRARAADGVSVEFRRCKVAFVSNASAVESLSVYYADANGIRQAKYGIQPTYTDPHHYRPVVVEYDADIDRTNIQLAEPGGSLVCVVTDSGPVGRSPHLNPTAACVPDGFNSPPEASFTVSVDGTELTGDPIEVDVDDEVTFSSTASDPDTYDRLRCEWDIDGEDGFEETGTEAKEKYRRAGTLKVRHRVIDDFGEEDTATLAVEVVDSAKWSRSSLPLPDGLGGWSRFGSAVAISDDRIVVGANFVDFDGDIGVGAAYVYGTSDISSAPTELVSAKQGGENMFGTSVAASDKSIAVGELKGDEIANNSGSAYLFGMDVDPPSQTALLPNQVESVKEFGDSIAISGDTVIVGSPADQGGGAVYEFDLAGGSPASTEHRPEEVETDNRFGSSVAVSGERVVVGAPADGGDEPDAGAVYVFNADGSSGDYTRLVAPDGAPGDKFGSSVSISDGTIVVGSTGHEDAGIAYVYDAMDLSSPVGTLVPSNLEGIDNFGASAAVSGETVVVGAPGSNDAAGAAYEFDLSTDSFHSKRLSPDGLSGGDRFGSSVSVFQGMVVVGAPYSAVQNKPQVGAVYLF